MTQSVRLGLPYLQAAQAQKEVTVNESLAVLDVAIGAAIDGFLADTPPATPALGNCFVLGTSPTGAWAGHPLALAGYTGGGWRFIAPVEGLNAIDKASGETIMFRSGAWEKGQARASKLSINGNQVVGPRLAAVTDPVGGAVVDAEGRAAIAAILARLREHGLIAS